MLALATGLRWSRRGWGRGTSPAGRGQAGGKLAQWTVNCSQSSNLPTPALKKPLKSHAREIFDIDSSWFVCRKWQVPEEMPPLPFAMAPPSTSSTHPGQGSPSWCHFKDPLLPRVKDNKPSVFIPGSIFRFVLDCVLWSRPPNKKWYDKLFCWTADSYSVNIVN